MKIVAGTNTAKPFLLILITSFFINRFDVAGNLQLLFHVLNYDHFVN